MFIKVFIMRSVKLSCEPIIRDEIPSIRYAIAHILSEKYKLNQDSISELLGLTQAAVNKYLNDRCSKRIISHGISLKRNSSIIEIASISYKNKNTTELNRMIDMFASSDKVH